VLVRGLRQSPRHRLGSAGEEVVEPAAVVLDLRRREAARARLTYAVAAEEPERQYVEIDLGGKLPSVVKSLTLFAIVAVLLFVATLVTRYTLTRDIETHLREVRAAHGTPATAPANEER